MSNVQITRDEAGKKIIVEKTLPATVGEVWAAYSDGDVMAKWWGPKTWPASSISFDFTPGGHWRYCMTGPDGTKACGKLEYTSVDAPNSFSAKDAFTDEAGNVNATLPSTDWRVTFEEQGNTTKVTSELSFSSAADMQKIIDMGFEAGFTESMSNLEEYLGR